MYFMLFDVMKATGWSFSAVKDKAFFIYVLILSIIQGPEKVIGKKNKIYSPKLKKKKKNPIIINLCLKS